ncbi:MAG: DUF2809 domain-containing protein [Pseudomonadota bacterium]|nr:DUF2809 domain-containing protein [Pseudomonadota bacterium]
MRSRWVYLVACVATVALGLASRSRGAPPFVVAYAGDALYAVLIYWMLRLVWPRASGWWPAIAAWCVCALIEASQAWHPAWLDAVRAHRPVALVLGRGFLWSDLGCYAVGVVGAGMVEVGVGRWLGRR